MQYVQFVIDRFGGGLVVPCGGQLAQGFEKGRGQHQQPDAFGRIQWAGPVAKVDLPQQEKAHIDRHHGNTDGGEKFEHGR